MNIAEIKRIVQGEKNKLKHFENVEKAIMELESLEQYESDFTRKIENLKKESDKLKEENDSFAEKNAIADAKLKDKIELASMNASRMIDEAHKKAKDIISGANNEFKNTSLLVQKNKDEVELLAQKKNDLRAELMQIEDALSEAKKKLEILLG